MTNPFRKNTEVKVTPQKKKIAKQNKGQVMSIERAQQMIAAEQTAPLLKLNENGA